MTSRAHSQLSARQSRIVGALLGLHAGDSLGATYEFESHAAMAARRPEDIGHIVGGGAFAWPAGHATDDTDMARGVLLAYQDRKPGDDVARLAGDYFLRWQTGDWPGRQTGSSPVDIGVATLKGLNRYHQTRDPDRAGAGQGSAGNGSLMRCLPTGLFQTDRDKLVEESVRISKVTHDDARCTVSARDLLIDVVRIGGDTDTNAAVAGGLLGARDGEEGIPAEWREKLQFAQEFREVALAMTDEQQGTPSRDREL
ncbi:hypothetical protein HIM_08915 [Hirsutella minnesotensis 3608]|uniref:ADP-ribosylhydrolase ARH3 n=1 Tax=Hirsutella minnesotensis 3608 TaxID=1043627 RepID=A0A0F7ZSP4_9HYPO|nr:hypothetical protein HIM_08915 [Hirsutella minnesotensis 3608]